MALVAFEGFDHYATAGSDLLNRAGAMEWSSAGGSFASPGRTGVGSYFELQQNGVASCVLTTPISHCRVGFAMQALFGGGAAPSIGFTGTAVVLQVDYSRNGFNLSVNGSIVAASVNNAIIPSAWNYVEIEIVVSASGTVNVVNNGQVVMAASVNTLVGGAADLFGVAFNGPRSPTTGSLNIDDLYVADNTLGPGVFPFNDFVGDVRSIELNPIGNGSVTQWTPLTSTNWVEVSDVHNTGDASYNSSATPTQEDLFTFAALAGTISSVLAVQVIGSYRKDDAALRQITQSIVSSGTPAAGTTYNISTTYTYAVDLFMLDPATSAAWTVAGVNAAQAGYTLTA